MSNVIAFVAHSFTDTDSVHVNCFLEFLSRISKLNPRFTWEHAREAEPSDLKEKVLRTAGKANLLIAICSRKERVFKPDSARISKINRRELVVPEGECVWATSDWVTQEIGMAIGRDWDIILLIENGVRNPGGMQGNLEYISFDRNALEPALQSLMEMISSLTSDGALELAETTSAGDIQSTSEFASKPQASEASAVRLPSASMTLEEFELGIVDAMLADDPSLLQKYDEMFRASEVGASEVARGRWDSRREWLQQIFKGNGNLAKVRALAERFESDDDIAHYHAILLSALGEEDAAGAEFARAAAAASDPVTKVRRLADAAASFWKADDAATAFELLADARSTFNGIQSPEAELYLINALSEILGKEEKLLHAAVAERHLQLKPDDQDARFKLGYLYGDIDQSSLSLHQYLRIPHEARNAWTWNNLGVAYGSIGVKGSSTEAYEKAESLGNTLATSNRARLLRDSGFLKLAEAACKEALSKSNANFPALGETLSSISSQRTEEQKKESDAIRKAQSVEGYMKKLGAGLISRDIQSWGGKWKGPKYEMDIAVTDNGLVAKAEFERPSSSLRRPGLAGYNIGDPPKAEVVHVAIDAKTYGRAAYGKVEARTGSSLATILGGLNSSKIFLLMDAAENQIQILEVAGDGDFKTYELVRIASSS